MAVSKIETSSSVAAQSDLNFMQMLQELAPLLFGFVAGLIILFLLWKIFSNTKIGKKLIDYDVEVYKNDLKELKRRKISNGLAGLFFTIFLIFICNVIGVGVSYVMGLELWLYAVMFIVMTLFASIAGIFIQNIGQKWFDKNPIVYNKNLIPFGLVNSRPIKSENGVLYILVKRGIKWLLFPDNIILALPIAKTYSFETVDENGKKHKHTYKINKTDKAFYKNDKGDYIINSLDFEQHGKYFYPVIKMTANNKDDLFSFRDVAFAINKRKADELTIYDLGVETRRNTIVLASANPYSELGNRTDTKIDSESDTS